MVPTSSRALFLASEAASVRREHVQQSYSKKKWQNEVRREEKVRSQAALEVKLELWTGLAENNCALSSPPHDAKPAPLQNSPQEYLL